MKFIYNKNTFKIFFTFLVSILSAFFFTTFAGTYTTGTNISVPIFFNAGGSVSAMEFFVSVSGGNLVSLRCGGAGFSNIASGGNKCVVANLGGGASSGTVATATVRGNSPGTLTVSVSGKLSSTSGSQVSGSFSGASHTIIKGTPPGQKTTTDSTGVAELPVEEETVPVVEPNPVMVKTKDGRQSQAKDRSVFGGTVNLDSEVTEVVFTKEWDLREDVSLSIDSNENVALDFNALKDPATEGDVAQVYK